MSDKPSVLILGGLPTAARQLTSFLVPENGDSLVSNLRIVDKYSVHPPTTYLGSAFSASVKKPIVQYQQANLLIPATLAKVFDPPEGWKPFSYVFDCTGDTTYERPDEIQKDNTAKLAYAIGLEAARRKVSAHVRLHHPYYETPLEKRVADEREDLKPAGTRGIWWHEAIRLLGGIPDLNLVVVRGAAAYGTHHIGGLIVSRVVLGRVYKHLDEEMKYLWSPEIRTNTVHLDDVVGAMWAVAKWMEPLGRQKANELAGEVLHYHAPGKANLVEDLEGHLPEDKSPVVPLFQIVDDSDSTQESVGKAVADFYGIKFGFYGFIVNTKLKLDFNNMVEEINSKHVEAWTDICMKSNPPIINPVLQAYIDGHLLKKFSVAYKGDKIKSIVGYQLKRPKFDNQTIKEIIDEFRKEGNWPTYQDTV